MDIEHLTKLSRLKIEDDKIDRIKSDLVSVMKLIDQISDANIIDVPEYSFFSDEELLIRPDIVVVTDVTPLSNAPKQHDNFFIVPKVIE